MLVDQTITVPSQTTVSQSLPNGPQLVQVRTLFRGSAGNPLLAPRGVWVVGEKLLVADTGQNRVFIWNQLPSQEEAEPDVVLGQPQVSSTQRNAGGEVGPDTLLYPSGIWSDGERLIIADAWNHRVLIWHRFPTQSGQPADVVVGQADFQSNQPNEKGIGATPTARSLNWPYGVVSDGTQLWVADTGNRRVLYFRTIPTRQHTAADGVIGKDSFTERDYENQQPLWPYAVRLGPNDELAIADTQYYRTLIWKNRQDAFHKPADVLIGQPDFDANGQNQYGLFPGPNTLSWTYDCFFHRQGLLVADTGNSRLLWFNRVPLVNNQSADNLIGHASFQTSSENANTRFGTDNQLYWPFSICIDGNILALADTGNHRIVLYHLYG